jgi:beta-lactam-binding protein with PASTA domain
VINAAGRCAVPDLAFEYQLAAAKQLLVGAGCRLGKLRYESSKFARGLVIGQTPRWGSVLRRGGLVDLVISKG